MKKLLSALSLLLAALLFFPSASYAGEEWTVVSEEDAPQAPQEASQINVPQAVENSVENPVESAAEGAKENAAENSAAAEAGSSESVAEGAAETDPAESAAAAETDPAGASAPQAFTDLSETHWAKPYIDVARGTGLIEGYTAADGSAEFRPDRNVTKQECLVMLCNTLLKAEGAWTLPDYTGEWKDFFSLYQTPESGLPQGIPVWARIYAAYALQKGICLESDFSQDMDGEGRSGGYAYASRRLVAVWTARALQLETLPLFEPVYADSEEIGTEFLPYTDSLYRHGIMQGNNGYFHPLSGVRRCEMAAVCTRLLGVRVDEEKALVTEYGRVQSDFSVLPGSLYDRESWLGSALLPRLVRPEGSLLFADAEGGMLALQTEEDRKFFCVSPSARILLDGTVVQLSDLESIQGCPVCLAFVQGAEDVLYVQTGPAVLTGSIEAFRRFDDASLLTLRLADGTKADLLFTGNTVTDIVIETDTVCRLIADGLEILEMR